MIGKYPENGPLKTAECHNEIRRELANCSCQNQKESKYLDTMRAATGILVDQVGNYQPLKDDDVPCCLYISRGLNNVTYEVHTFILEGSSRLTPGEISPHRCNTRILYLPTSLYLVSFSFSSDLSNRLFQGSFQFVFFPLHMSNMCFFPVAQKLNLRLGHPILEVPRSHTIRHTQARARGGR